MSAVRGSRSLLGILLALVVVVVGAVVAVRVAAHGSEGAHIVWQDNFTGKDGATPSSSTWTREQGYFGSPYHSLECMTDSSSNSHLNGKGDLEIVAQHAPTECGSAGTKDYTSARLTSRGLHAMRYGYLQIRARMGSGAGIWNALWLLGSDYPQVGWPRSGEIDLGEVTSFNPDAVYSTVHGPTSSGAPFAIAGKRTSSSLASQFHDYGLAWSPTGLEFTFDHFVYLRVSKAEVERQGQWVFDKDFNVLLDVAVGGDWPGSPSSTTVFPNAMSIDYVRVYSAVPPGA